MRVRMENLNPSVKAGTVMICAVLLSFQYIIALNTAVFSASVAATALFSNADRRRLAALLTPALVAALGLFVMGLYYARDGGEAVELGSLSMLPYAVRETLSRNLMTALQLATRLLAYAGLGISFALTTDGEDFVMSLMQQCHMPPKFAYGVLAAFNLMPNIAREMTAVRTAFEVRGVRAGLLRPLFTMLVNSVRWSENIAMAMESKGFDGDAERTCYSVTRVRWYDVLFSFSCVGMIIAGMTLLK